MTTYKTLDSRLNKLVEEIYKMSGVGSSRPRNTTRFYLTSLDELIELQKSYLLHYNTLEEDQKADIRERLLMTERFWNNALMHAKTEDYLRVLDKRLKRIEKAEEKVKGETETQRIQYEDEEKQKQ